MEPGFTYDATERFEWKRLIEDQTSLIDEIRLEVLAGRVFSWAYRADPRPGSPEVEAALQILSSARAAS